MNAGLINSILVEAGTRTASVSREHMILRSGKKQTEPAAVLQSALEEDCQENGWIICDPQ